MAKKKYCVYNTSRETFLSLGVHAADTAVSRLRGMLGKLKLTTEDGLWVVPSRGIHTLGLLFPLDIIYLDADCRVIHLQESFQPFGIAPLIAQAASVLQLATHSIYSSHTQLGDKMLICEAEEMEKRLKQGIVPEPPLISGLAETIANGPLSLLVRPFASGSALGRKTSKVDAQLDLVSALEMAIVNTATVGTSKAKQPLPRSATNPKERQGSTGPRSEWKEDLSVVEDGSDSSKDNLGWRPGLMTAISALEKTNAFAGPRPVDTSKLESKRMASESMTVNRIASAQSIAGAPAAGGAAAATANYSRRREDMARAQSRQVGNSPPAGARPLRHHEETNLIRDMQLVANDSKELGHLFRIDEVLLQITNVHDGIPGGGCVVKTNKSKSSVSGRVKAQSRLRQDALSLKQDALSAQSDKFAPVAPVASEAAKQEDRERVQLVPVAFTDEAAAPRRKIEATSTRHQSLSSEATRSSKKAAASTCQSAGDPVPRATLEETVIEKRPTAERHLKQRNAVTSSLNSFAPSSSNSSTIVDSVVSATAHSASSTPLCRDEITNEAQDPILCKEQVKTTETIHTPLMHKLRQWLFRIDRRRDDREPVDNLSAYFWSGNRAEPQTVGDISATGLYLKTDERWCPGTVIRMTLQQGQNGEDISPEAISVESMTVRQDKNGVGLCFVLPDATKGELPMNANFDGAGSKKLKAFLKRFLNN